MYISGFGPKSVALAGRIGDGYVSTKPNGDLVHAFREAGGGSKPAQAGFKACYAATEDEAVQIAYQRWPNAGVPGELSQVLPSPRHFEQAGQLVRPEAMKETFVCGPDPEKQLEMIDRYAKAGFDEVYVSNCGPNQRDFFQMYARDVIPQLGH